jgi:oxygen-independent coproporphyrinogen-3 oxidase
MTPTSLYFHIPFCAHRCAYCDFNTYAGQEDSIPAYVKALCNEIRVVAGSAPERVGVHTVFFGGGTPSLLSAAQFEAIFKSIRESFDLTPGAEISLEANPGTLSFAYLQELFNLGFNRLSLGVQSAHPDELHLLERIHDYFDVVEAVAWARRAGFDNLNLDLIFGLPEQTLARWQSTVKLILGLKPEHLSLYALTLEHGTPFGRWAAQGLMPLPDPDAAADMYEWSEEALGAAGFGHYEISNWAQPGRECRHNLQYWRNLPYLGLGAGAHGFASSLRYSDVLRIKTYIDRCAPGAGGHFPLSPAAVNSHRLTPREEMQETMITGLRLTQEGVSAAVFRERFGVGLTEAFGGEIESLIGLGLLEWSGERLRLTVHGRLLGNQAFLRFVN